MARVDEKLISWNIANFVTVILMIAIAWCFIGLAGHTLVRQPAQRNAAAGDMTGSDGYNTPPVTDGYGGGDGSDDAPDYDTADAVS
jgi:hypothetical protein